ncbi:MAG: signal peptidase II [Clostridiaceae bacterium]|nr:signal peptidase II [Clostridiaceae bacterium]
MIWIIIAVIIIAADQASKHIIVKHVEYNSLIPVINKFFYITYHENKGAAWGILQNRLYILIPLTIVVSAVMVYILVKTESRMLKLSLSFVLGGAIGNLIDRISKGKVVDFLDFYFGKYNFPTFNVADTFIVIGTILLAVFVLFFYEKTGLSPGRNQ